MNIPIIVATTYLSLIFGNILTLLCLCLLPRFFVGLKRLMETREPLSLRYPLAGWNLAVTLFSVVGSLRTLPTLVSLTRNWGITGVVCGDTRVDWLYNDAAGFWTWMFILSKLAELTDTIFIVLRKRQLLARHWYHHLTVMMFCWHSWGTHSTYGIFFAAMNFTVHALTYMFYFLAALELHPSNFSRSLTFIQLMQMLIGSIVAIYVVIHMSLIEPQEMLKTAMSSQSLEWNYNFSEIVDLTPTCKVNAGNALAGLAMYASYLGIFCKLFYHRYLSQGDVRCTKQKMS